MATGNKRHWPATRSHKGASYVEAAFERPNPILLWSATLVFSALSVLLAIVAYFGSQGLTDRQIAGAKRVLASLNAEDQVLTEQAHLARVPGQMWSSEERHIREEIEDTTKELEELQKEAANG